MKTPREILLQRHAAAAPKLDAIRREVVQELSSATKQQSFPVIFVSLLLRCSNQLWLELVWPCRRTWVGLAAVWVVLALFNLTQTERGQIVVAKSASPVAMRLAFLEQRQILDEIIGSPPPAPPAKPPRRPSNKPRSEKRVTLMLG